MTPEELRIKEPLPALVKIGARDYWIEDWHPTAASAVRKYGETDHQNFIIRVDTSFPRAQTADTLLHEILHAIWGERQLEDEDKEERTVATLASGLCAVMRDNPDLMPWIEGALKG